MTILLYHSVNPKVDDPRCQVTPSTLRRHFETLLEWGIVFRPLSVESRAGPRASLAAGEISVTFDDGYEDFVEHALPVLEDLEIPAAQFICPAHVGDDNSWNYRAAFRARHMDLPTLRDLRHRAVMVQPHGWSHRNFLRKDVERLGAELDRCVAYFHREFGDAPPLLAYPYGDVGPGQVGTVSARFSAAFAVDPLPHIEPRFAIPRVVMVEMMNNEDLREIRRHVASSGHE